MAVKGVRQVINRRSNLPHTLVGDLFPGLAIGIYVYVEAEPLQLENFVRDKRLRNLREHSEHVAQFSLPHLLLPTLAIRSPSDLCGW